MKTLRGFGDMMSWMDVGKRSYELRAGSDVVATLSWPNGYSSPGQGETADGKITIERSGLLKPRVIAREGELSGKKDGDAAALSQRAPLLSLDVDFGGRGMARSREEKSFEWVPQNIWRTTWAFTDGGKPIATFETDSSLTSFGHKVKVVGDSPELSALVLLGSAVGVYLTEDSAIFGI